MRVSANFMLHACGSLVYVRALGATDVTDSIPSCKRVFLWMSEINGGCI